MKKLLLLAAFSIVLLGCVAPPPGDTNGEVSPNITIGELIDLRWFNTADGGTATFRVQHLQGVIENLGSYTVEYSVNGIESTLDVGTDGSFDEEIILKNGTNSITITLTNGTHDIMSESFSATLNKTSSAVTVILRWGTNQTDLDLHVWDPSDRKTSSKDGSNIPFSSLIEEYSDGTGTEILELSQAYVGTYKVRVRYHNNSIPGSNATFNDSVDARVYIMINEGNPTLYGPYTFTADMAQGDNDTNDWHVSNFSVPGAKEVVGCGGETKSAAELVSIGDVAECEDFGLGGAVMDELWYKLVLTNETNRINVSTVSPATCDLLQLYLWNWEDKQVDASARSTGNEYIARILENGTYYIEIRQQTVLYCRFNDITMSINYY